MRQFSIRYKFLSVTTLLLVVSLLAFLAMAAREIKGDKTEMVFDYNRSLVTNLASDLETTFRAVSDKLSLVAYFMSEKDQKGQELVMELLAKDSNIVFVGASDQFLAIDRSFYLNSSYLETYGVKDSYLLEELKQTRPVPFDEIQVKGQWIWNATLKDGPPLLGFAKSVVAEASDGTPIRQFAVIAYVRADKLLAVLTQNQLSEVMVANRTGDPLLHSDLLVTYGERQARAAESTLAALNSPTRIGVKDLGGRWLSAYAKSFDEQLIVSSSVEGSQAFAVVGRLMYRSVLFGTMVLTLSFILAILLSRSLTRPIQTLVEGMEKVSSGDLNTQIDVRTRDEIHALAESFNVMIRDLKRSREELEEINRELENKVKERTLQLERQNQAVKSAQEALLTTTRLAAVGEIAGRAAHEVLNPLTILVSRLEKVKSRLRQEAKVDLEISRDVLDAWRREVDQSGFDRLVQNWKSPSQVIPNVNLFEEDWQNLHHVGESLWREWQTLDEDVDFLLREAQRINRIVQSMRSLSVVNPGQTSFSLRHLAQEAVDVMADLASKEEISLGLMAPRDIADLIRADRDELLQSLTNLIRNAIQAVSERRRNQSGFKGEIQLELTEQGDLLALRIRDNGTGIELSNQARLFESQFTTKPRSEGTGLGLSISRRFVRAFGGDIRLESSVRMQGTVFLVTLPKADLSQKEAA